MRRKPAFPVFRDAIMKCRRHAAPPQQNPRREALLKAHGPEGHTPRHGADGPAGAADDVRVCIVGTRCRRSYGRKANHMAEGQGDKRQPGEADHQQRFRQQRAVTPTQSSPAGGKRRWPGCAAHGTMFRQQKGAAVRLALAPFHTIGCLDALGRRPGADSTSNVEVGTFSSPRQRFGPHCRSRSLRSTVCRCARMQAAAAAMSRCSMASTIASCSAKL